MQKNSKSVIVNSQLPTVEFSAEHLEYISYFKTPAGMADMHWPSEAEVAKAGVKKKISQNTEIRC